MKLSQPSLAGAAVACLLLSFSGSIAQAQSLLAWDFNGKTDSAAEPADTIAANLVTGTGYNIVDRFGVSAALQNNNYASTNWNVTDTFDAANSFVYFVVEPEAGFEVTLTELQYNITGNNGAPATGIWGYSIGGGDWTYSPTFTIGSNGSTDSLASWDFVDFTTAESVELRFYAYGSISVNGGTSNTGSQIRLANLNTGNDLVLLGSVATASSAIPEPSSSALLAGVLVSSLALGRRRRRSC